MMAGAIVKDVAFFAGTVIGSFLGGAEQALDRRKRVTHVPGVGYTHN
jgi:hypothetical protein